MSLESFDEGRMSEGLDPLDGQTMDFPFEEVAARLDGGELSPSVFELGGEKLRAVLAWAIGESANPSRHDHEAGVRSFAMALCVANSPAERFRLADQRAAFGIGAGELRAAVADFKRRFGDVHKA